MITTLIVLKKFRRALRAARYAERFGARQIHKPIERAKPLKIKYIRKKFTAQPPAGQLSLPEFVARRLPK